jgi:hypothetical protein
MRKEIREVDNERGIVRITTPDERWYMKPSEDPVTKLPIYLPVPSSTWIAEYWPKGIYFYKWLADKGWNEAEAIKVAAGDKGSKVHLAISAILEGKEVRIDSKFVNPSTGNEEELTTEEVDCIMSFVNWRKDIEVDYIVESIVWDKVVFSDQHNYAGTLDWVIRVTLREGGKNHLKIDRPTIYIVDFKTSANLWTSFEIQLAEYAHTVENGENPIMKDGQQINVAGLRRAILQVGYKRNKDGYKWNEIADAWDKFLVAQKIWKSETEGQAPKQRDYPIVISPAVVKMVQEGKTEISTEPVNVVETIKKTKKK